MILEINGNKKLKGEIKICGAKNSSIPCLIASLLSPKPVKLYNIPLISDINVVLNILQEINVKVDNNLEYFLIDQSQLKYVSLKIDEIKRLRASYYFMGVFLALFSQVEIYYPGGCAFEDRPIDFHLNGFKTYGAEYEACDKVIKIYRKKNLSGKFILPKKSVGATINLLLSFATSKEMCIIENASTEPEVKDVLKLLQKMGYQYFITEKEIIYNGYVIINDVVSHHVISDRIVALSYIYLALALGEIKIIGDFYPLIKEEIINLKNKKANITIFDDGLLVKISKLDNFNVIADVYPHFPTDLIQVISPLLTQTNTSYLEDRIFDKRIETILDLKLFKANVALYGKKVVFNRSELVKANTEAKDLRHSFMLVFAALMAKGTSFIKNGEYLLRGYPNIINDLKKLGANIKIKNS